MSSSPRTPLTRSSSSAAMAASPPAPAPLRCRRGARPIPWLASPARLTSDGPTVRNRLVPETSPGVYELRVILTQTGARLPYFVTADADGLPAPKPDTGFLFATAS